MVRYILVKEGESIRKVEVAEFSEERMLQEMIEKHPEVLSIPANGSIVPLVKEYPVNTGSVDLIAFDEDGRIYIIETKLHKNYDKRKALAQLIEYASQIAIHDTFEDFKAKIYGKTGKTLEEIVKENFGENCEEVLNKLKESFEKENFALVLVMDELDDPLKDMIIFLNKHLNIGVFGVEIKRFELSENAEIFVPSIVGIDVKPPEHSPEEEFIKNYSKFDLGEVARRIIDSFRNAEKKYDNVKMAWTQPGYRYLTLRIYDTSNIKIIDLSIKIDPNGDHGVWVHNSNLYNAVAQIGENLGLNVGIPSSERFGKVIDFNGIEGIRSAVEKFDKLIEGLVKVAKASHDN